QIQIENCGWRIGSVDCTNYAEIIVEDNASLRSRIEFRSVSDPTTVHTYYLGTRSNADPSLLPELTTVNTEFEINLNLEPSFGPLVDSTSYDVGYIVYDDRGNVMNKLVNWMENAKYDITRPEVVIGYGAQYSSIANVGGQYITDTTKVGDFKIWAKFGSELVDDDTPRTPKIAIDRGGTGDLTSTNMRPVTGNKSKWYYIYSVDSLTGDNPDMNSFVDGIATVSITAAVDYAGNTIKPATNNTFLIDTTPPTINNSSIETDNSAITVTFTDAFSSDVYNTSAGSGALEVDDFVLKIANGTAKFAGGLTRASPTAIDLSAAWTYKLTLPLLDTIPDGQEVITISPKVEEGPPVVYHIFDRIG
ncbi:uncharacterized protein METZ01_LOCUS318859, partial [marine metagenome]